jgi:hypothetical protein
MPELAAETGYAPAALDFRLSPAERWTFLWLAAGHLLFAIVLMAGGEALGDNGLYLITPLFGLPLVLLGPRDRLAARAFVLLIGFAAVHYGAVWLARNSYAVPFTGAGFTSDIGLCGAIGGAVGAAVSFALCRLFGLVRPGAGAMLVTGTLVLTIVGAVGVSILMVNLKGESLAWMLLLYTPWQLAFAYFLAKTLRG